MLLPTKPVCLALLDAGAGCACVPWGTGIRHGCGEQKEGRWITSELSYAKLKVTFYHLWKWDPPSFLDDRARILLADACCT